MGRRFGQVGLRIRNCCSRGIGVLIVLLLMCSFVLAWEYDAGTPITSVSITNPTANEVWLIGSDHTLTCTSATDTDRRRENPESNWENIADSVTHYWTGTGTFKNNDNVGTSVTYICTDTAGSNTVTVYADDNYGPDNNTAIVDESPTSDSETVSVVGLAVNQVGFGGGNHTLYQTPAANAGWADGTTAISNPVYDADSGTNDATNYACYTKGAANATLTSVRCRATTALTEGSSFELRVLTSCVGTSGWVSFSIDQGNRQSGVGTLSLSGTLPSTVGRYGLGCGWYYRCPSGSNTELANTYTTHQLLVTYDTPDKDPTVKRLTFVCDSAYGLNEVTPCADAIYDALDGVPPKYDLSAENPSNCWLMMDPNGPAGPCVSQALLMQKMCQLLGLGNGEVGFIYGTTDNDCYSIYENDFEIRTCPGGIHGSERIQYYAGKVWNKFEAVFKYNGWYYAVKETKNQTPLGILQTILGFNNPGIDHNEKHQAWKWGVGHAFCCEDPGPHPAPLP